jgi:hypothetical protein
MKKLFLFAVSAILLSATIHEPAHSAARKILVEIFTSTTCAPCFAADDFYFNNWLPNYGGADQVITLSYHVWWPAPGDDPMYLANTAPVQARVSYYQGGTAYAPRAFIDGFIDGTSNFANWPGAVETRFLDPSPVSITLTGGRSGNTLNMNASIHADAAVNSSNWRVHWVMIEGDISQPQNSGNGYVPFIHHYVHRSMTPDANGSAIAISQGQTVNIPKTITIPGTWIPGNCKVIVFVQNNTDKKLQNAEIIDVGALTGVGEPGSGIPGTFALGQNYPNPFNPATTIQYAVNSHSFVSIKVFNLLGEEVRTLVSSLTEPGNHTVEWDAIDNEGAPVPSGVYLCTMTAGQFRETRKLILLK